MSAKDTNPKDAIGVKKAKISVIPSGVLFELGLAMLEGACKYGRHNYRVAGVRASVYYDAAMGHLMDYWEGQDIDPDSGRLHLVKAMASLAVWIDAIHQGKVTDDRPPPSKVLKSFFNDAAAEIIERHSDKGPKHHTIQEARGPDRTQWTISPDQLEKLAEVQRNLAEIINLQDGQSHWRLVPQDDTR